MDTQWEAILLNSDIESDHSFLPNSNCPVFILGREYLSLNDRNIIDNDINSRIWCTYRRNFKAINFGLKCDKGWGCMHRCGQMIMAECLVRNHLSRDWRWNPSAIDKVYWEIIKKFEDRSSALFSIHSIAMMGVSENKNIGEWLGPNTVSQILKKLVSFDMSNKIKVHVTNEEGIIYDEIKKFACEPRSSLIGKDDVQDKDLINCELEVPRNSRSRLEDEEESSASSTESDDFISKFVQIERQKAKEVLPDSMTNSEFYQPSDGESDEEAFEVIQNDPNILSFGQRKTEGDEERKRRTQTIGSPEKPWNPLLLMIPVRFGLNNIIPQYYPCIKNSLRYSQSLGILGGRPSHAQWYIGYIDNPSSSVSEMICLDPHTTQQAARFNSDLPSPSEDALFHCSDPTVVNLVNVDPSMSFGFFFKTEEEFDRFAERFANDVRVQDKYPLTGFYWTRPDNFRWKENTPKDNPSNVLPTNTDYELV